MMYQAEFIRHLVFIIAAAMMMTTAAFSQVIDDSTNPEPEDTTLKLTGFEALSPGNQNIAQSLFDVQSAQDGGGSWTLDSIAEAKQDGIGWGNVFKQLKEEGLIAEKNLGQVVSGKGMTDAGFGHVNKAQDFALQSPTANALSDRLLRPRRTSLVVTTANGRRVVVGLKKPGLRSYQGAFAKASTGGGRATRGGFQRKSMTSMSASRTTASLSAGRGANKAGSSRGGGRKIK